MIFFRVLALLWSISLRIWVARKFLNFHTVIYSPVFHVAFSPTCNQNPWFFRQHILTVKCVKTVKLFSIFSFVKLIFSTIYICKNQFHGIFFKKYSFLPNRLVLMHQILTCQKIYCSVFTRPLHLTSAFNNDMAPSQQGHRSHLKFWGEKGHWDGGTNF